MRTTPLQQDSIESEGHQPQEIQLMQEHEPEKPRHPYEVLRSLPEDATPAQQDSAIQSVFRVENTHLSTRPDTLHLPLPEKGHSIASAELPQYYRKNFFSKDTLFYEENMSGRYGVAGEPMPYTVRGDDTITGLLIGCFILALVAFSKARRFIIRQAKDFFHEPKSSVTEFTETSGEFRFQLFLVLQTCLLMSLVAFLYTLERVSDTFILSSQYQLIGIFFASFLAYFLLKVGLGHLINSVFFSKKKSIRWLKAQVFVISAEGVAMFPAVMLLSFFSMSLDGALAYTALVIIAVKILLLYKSYVIFFKRKGFFLQIFLYFCALEIVPLLSLQGVMAMVINYLKIKY